MGAVLGAVLGRFIRDARGASAIEYTLIALLMAAALLALWPGFYGDFMQTWINQGEKIRSVTQ
jgi:Flp pilus assembly pilin Flp